MAARAPDLFSNNKAAKNWISRQWAQFANNIISDLSPFEGTYRISGRPGQAKRYIVSPRHRAPKAVLEHHVGEVVRYDGPEDKDVVDYVQLPGSDKKYCYRIRLREETIPGVGICYEHPILYQLENPPLVIKRGGAG